MATNFFFNNFKNSQEQLLLENLVIESIKIYGEDMYYLPRTLVDQDLIYQSDSISQYNSAYMIEMYIKSVNGFSGDGVFMSKFGLEIRDQVTFSVAQRVFNDEVQTFTNILRPNEGDLIYFPLNKKAFEIKYVENKEFFYQLGALQTYELTCELFEYSSEVFNTGIEEIDQIQTKFSLNIFDWAILDENGDRLLDENADYIVVEGYSAGQIDALADNEDLQTESDNFLDFAERDPFSEGGTY
jgi:hypothetical protein